IIPTLVALEPWRRKELADLPWPLPEDINKAYAHLHKQLRKQNLKPGWIWHFNMAESFVEEHVFTGDKPRNKSFLEKVYASPRGKAIAKELSRLRRQLRVKRVADEEIFEL
ncbi:MAG: hypothetical protein ACREH5_03895, partial [Candidatus Omnitrophota bacterium]